MPTTEQPNQTMSICRPCPMCRKYTEVMVDPRDWRAYSGGLKPIQTAFPYLTAAEREVLITGYDEKCWALLFPPDDEDEED